MAAWWPAYRRRSSPFGVCPDRPDLNGCDGDHQTSFVRPLPRPPSAATADGNSSALATVTIFVLNPCCHACDQKVAKSGGMNTPVTISTLAALKAAICAVKSFDSG